jgi:hypothetical protein
MKYNTGLLFLLLLAGCAQNNESEESTREEVVNADTVMQENKTTGYDPDSKLFIWKVTPDYKKIRNASAGPALQNADTLIKGLNQLYENVYLEKIKISGDTIYTVIKDAAYLTEQMGTTGAEIYLADLVLNLTSVAGIKYVNLDLAEGSHMQPGVWSADNFKKYTEIK